MTDQERQGVRTAAEITTDQSATASLKPRRRLLRPILYTLLLLAFAASIYLNVRLYHQAIQNYIESSAVRLDPYGVKQPDFPADTPAGSAGQSLPVVVFLGDSRARAWPAPKVPGYRFANRGINSQTTEQINGRYEAHVSALSPRIVVLQAGINDLKTVPLFPARRDHIVADCKANLRNIVSRARTAGAVVIVTTIFPPGDVPFERRSVWSPEVERAVDEVNADLRTLAGDGVIVLDAWKLLESNGRLRDDYGIDMLHLNAQGYAVLNAELTRVMPGK